MKLYELKEIVDRKCAKGNDTCEVYCGLRKSEAAGKIEAVVMALGHACEDAEPPEPPAEGASLHELREYANEIKLKLEKLQDEVEGLRYRLPDTDAGESPSLCHNAGKALGRMAFELHCQ